MTLWYVLVDRRLVPCDVETWEAFLGNEDRIVAVSDVREFHISTVFLGLDHNFSGEGPPLLFETLVTAGEDACGCDTRRYSTWDEAERGHEDVVRRLMAEAN